MAHDAPARHRQAAQALHSALAPGAEALLDRQCSVVLASCAAAAAPQIRRRAVAAMEALRPPGLEQAPAETAAAIVAENAQVAAERRLAQLVPARLQAGFRRLAERVASRAAKSMEP